MTSHDMAVLRFDGLEKALTEKYGTSTYKKPGRHVSWKLAKTTINLDAFDVDVSLRYEPTAASAGAADQL